MQGIPSESISRNIWETVAQLSLRGALSLVFNTLHLGTRTEIARMHPSAEKSE